MEEKYAQAIMRDMIRDGWPEQGRPEQSVYAIRLAGEVAVQYPTTLFSVVYVGEGNASAACTNIQTGSLVCS